MLTLRLPVVIGLLFLLVVTGAACGGDGGATPEAVTGVITEVSWSEDRTEVRSFILDGDDDDYEIWIDDEVEYGFDLAHLEEHRTTGEPVRVELRNDDGELYAERIDDA